MYSVLLSKIVKGMELVQNDLSKIIKKDSKVVVIPWAFPTEIDSDRLLNDYFKEDGIKYNKYVLPLINIGIKKSNIEVLDCYSNNILKLKEKINNSDILVIPGGNPEMLFSKVVMETELLYDIKHYKGIIIGESAGACLHFKRYFITAKNNYYKYFAWYDGFGIINDPIYIDVHSSMNKLYINKLKNISNTKNKDLYLIYDDGAIILNRENNDIKTYGHVIKIGNDNEFNCK